MLLQKESLTSTTSVWSPFLTNCIVHQQNDARCDAPLGRTLVDAAQSDDAKFVRDAKGNVWSSPLDVCEWTSITGTFKHIADNGRGDVIGLTNTGVTFLTGNQQTLNMHMSEFDRVAIDGRQHLYAVKKTDACVYEYGNGQWTVDRSKCMVSDLKFSENTLYVLANGTVTRGNSQNAFGNGSVSSFGIDKNGILYIAESTDIRACHMDECHRIHVLDHTIDNITFGERPSIPQ